jgi:hypothetical protein
VSVRSKLSRVLLKIAYILSIWVVKFFLVLAAIWFSHDTTYVKKDFQKKAA